MGCSGCALIVLVIYVVRCLFTGYCVFVYDLEVLLVCLFIIYVLFGVDVAGLVRLVLDLCGLLFDDSVCWFLCLVVLLIVDVLC